MDTTPATSLPVIRRFSYGVGHVLNDLCASMWFTYLLIFYHKVLQMGNVMAGVLLLIGQVADALATPFVGYESDRINGCCGYGKRKSWHLIGTICVASTFAFIFMPVLGSDPLAFNMVAEEPSNLYHLMIYYAPFIVIFQFGWASTQISHLSLIPSLSKCEHDKVGLNSIRYAFTVISNITVYVIAILLLSVNLQTGSSSDGDINPADYIVFRTLALIVIGIGCLFSIIFHVGTKERQETALTELEATTSVRRRMRVLCWLKTPQFYMVALLYMCTRLIVNIPQVYLSMYLTESLSLSKQYIAIVPLVVFVSGFLATFPIKILSKKIGKKIVYIGGLVLVVAASLWYKFLLANSSTDQYLVMVAGALSGVGSSTVLVLSLSLTADLIDQNTESAAFVYGAMSFTDKLSNGLAVQIIQIIHPCKNQACCDLCAGFYRSIMVWMPIGCAVIALVALLLIKRRTTTFDVIEPKESDQTDSEDQSEPLLNGSSPNSRYSSINTTTAPAGSGYSVHAARRIKTKSVSADEKPTFVVGSTPNSHYLVDPIGDE